MADKVRMKTTRQTVLAEMIRKHGWKHGAELGLWQGATFGYLLDTFPDLHLIGVDNWQAVGPYEGKEMRASEMMVRQIVARHWKRAEILKMSTVEAASTVENGSLDFVFVDASHDTKSVLDDLDAWYPKVRAGGYMTGHDANLPSVQAALDQSLLGWTRIEANVWIYPCA